MKSIFTEKSGAIIEAIETIKEHADTTVSDMLLTADLLDDSKGQIYEEIYKHYDNIFKASIVQDKATGQFSIERKAWKEKAGKYGWTNVLSAEFKCWPKDVDKIPVAFSSIAQDIKDGKIKKDGDIGKAWRAINRFSSWVNGYQVNIIKAHIEKLNANMLERITAETIAEQQATTPEELEKATKDAKDKFGAVKLESKSPSRQAIRVIDGKGNVKADKVKELPIETAKELAKELAKSNPEMMAQALTVATGQAVSALPNVSELKASTLLLELRKHLGEFKVPTEAALLINQLETMLVVEQGVAIPTKIIRKRSGAKEAVAA